MKDAQTNERRTSLPDSLVARARGEYLEMPGLRLTVAQACRLWQLDIVLCAKLFDHLVSEGFLLQTGTGFYIACRDGWTSSDRARRH
jgi:hypothetical protein